MCFIIMPGRGVSGTKRGRGCLSCSKWRAPCTMPIKLSLGDVPKSRVTRGWVWEAAAWEEEAPASLHGARSESRPEDKGQGAWALSFAPRTAHFSQWESASCAHVYGSLRKKMVPWTQPCSSNLKHWLLFCCLFVFSPLQMWVSLSSLHVHCTLEVRESSIG